VKTTASAVPQVLDGHDGHLLARTDRPLLTISVRVDWAIAPTTHAFVLPAAL
jgi:hypothetical protein